MKKVVGIFLVLTFFMMSMYADVLPVLSLKSPLATSTIRKKVELVCTNMQFNRDSMSIKAAYVIPNIYVTPDTVLYPNTYFWHLDGCGVSTTPGTPSYPCKMEVFELPGDATNIELRIDTCKVKNFTSHIPTPARCALLADGSGYHNLENVPPIPRTVLSEDMTMAKIESVTHYRNKTLVYVLIQPCMYMSTITRVCEQLAYTITFESQQLMVENSSYEENKQGGYTPGFDFSMDYTPDVEDIPENYLIVTYEKYKNALQPFINWKKRCGSEVHVVCGDNWQTTTGNNSQTGLRKAIKNAIKEVYETDKNLMYVIFAGSTSELPGEEASYWLKDYQSQNQNLSTGSIAPQSDYYYMCMDGISDIEPDLISGRFMASTPEEMRIIVNKIVQYERSTVQDDSFYENVLHLAYFQDRANNRPVDGIEDMSCVHTSEYLRESAVQNGKNVTRLYTRTPNNEVMPKYMTSAVLTPRELLPFELRNNYKWYSSPSLISERINDGTLYVYYGGHGAYDGWTDPTYKVPFYNLSDSVMLPVIFSGACDTGRFYQGSFATKMLTYPSGGAVAVIAAERSHYDPIGLRMFRGIFNEFWPRDFESNIELHKVDPDGLTDKITQSQISTSKRQESDVERITLGKALYKGHRFISIFSSQRLNKYDMICKEVFHLFGDPGMVFHTNKPQVMTDVSFEIKTTAAFTKYYVLTLDEPALIGYYNEDNGLVSRSYGTCIGGLSSSKSTYHLTIQRYNQVPFSIYYRNGMVFTSAPLANSSKKGVMKILQIQPGEIKVAYQLSNELIHGQTEVELRDFNNNQVVSQCCDDVEGEVTLNSPLIQKGYYVITLKEEGAEPVYQKLIIR